METNTSQVGLALACFRKLHSVTLGAPYMVSWGKDQRVMKDVISVYGLNKSVAMMKTFFDDLRKDKFTSQSGATVGIFKSQIPKLLLVKERDESTKGILHAESLGDTAV